VRHPTTWTLTTVCLALAGSVSMAQAPTLRYDHVHLGTTDPVAHVAWYEQHIGGTPFQEANQRRLMFGGTRLQCAKMEQVKPSEGSAIDHIAFSVPDVRAKVQAMQAAGVKIVMPPRTLPVIGVWAIVEDPFRVRVELVQDPDLQGFHHAHLRVEDPSQAYAWFVSAFGGTRTPFKGQLDAVKYGDVWLLADQGAAAPSIGTAIDHLGWGPADLAATAAYLKAKGIDMTAAGRTAGYLEGVGGVRIELVQRQ